jgi:hypothetical protein
MLARIVGNGMRGRAQFSSLRACQTEQEVTDTLLWIVKYNPGASAATRRKWRKVTEMVCGRIRLDAMKETPRIIVPDSGLVMP